MITASIFSRFSSRKGSSTTKGCIERIVKLGGRIIEDDCIIIKIECDDRAHLDKIMNRLKIYSGLKTKFPYRIDSMT